MPGSVNWLSDAAWGSLGSMQQYWVLGSFKEMNVFSTEAVLKSARFFTPSSLAPPLTLRTEKYARRSWRCSADRLSIRP